ncbi:MAG: hypothetical protein N2545_03815, partial [Thermoflexales bacterium]|nr:hypothetical protein [Thermoflexales bacterium]
PDMVEAGARYEEMPADRAVTEGNLVTAPAWPAHPDWIAQFVKLLGARIELEPQAEAALA